MKTVKTICAGLLMLFSAGLFAAEAVWLDNFEKAKEQALEKKLPIFALFTGSDWCPGCMALESKVLSKPEFAAFAGKNLVLFKADFPRTKALQPGVAQQNERLSEKYGAYSFPGVLILDGKGKELKREEGFREMTPANYVLQVKEWLKGFSSP